MKIEKIERKIKKVNFENLEVGDCYLDGNGELCIKISTIFGETDDEYNSVCLENGLLAADFGEVTLVEATIQYYIK